MQALAEPIAQPESMQHKDKVQSSDIRKVPDIFQKHTLDAVELFASEVPTPLQPPNNKKNCHWNVNIIKNRM